MLAPLIVQRSALGALFLLALALRLVVWRWYEFYPLTGDEQEYLGQALTMLQERRYVELRLMRPPLYGVFLAASIYLVDSLIQNLRLVHAVISAATVVPMYLLTRELVWALRPPAAPPAALNQVEPEGSAATALPRTEPPDSWLPSLALPFDKLRSWAGLTPDSYASAAPLLAATLCALSYTLAAHATELLTETIFLFGLTTFFWLLLRAGRLMKNRSQESGVRSQESGVRSQETAWRLATGAAGAVLGALCLLRSVALPLLVLGGLWLIINAKYKMQNAKWTVVLLPFFIFTFAFCITVLPWTARNYLTYGALIIVDTTGPENLWLDNDPAGREAVKAQLYALGPDMAARQRLATEQGLAAILGDPGRFAAKAWGELKKFFALEYTDDMRARPAIWVPPAQVWTRLILGDGLWLLVLLLGSYSLGRHIGAKHPPWRKRLRTRQATRADASPLLFALWALYTVLTAAIFHVELRYRLPLYPALLPFAALALSQCKMQNAKCKSGVRPSAA